MSITIKRNAFLILAILATIAAFYASRIDYLLNGKLTTGEVVNFKIIYTPGFRGGGRDTAAIVQYAIDSVLYDFVGVTNTNLSPGKKVDVIYKLSEPSEAKVYSFYGFWYAPWVNMFLPLMIVMAIIVSCFKKTAGLTIGKRKRQQ